MQAEAHRMRSWCGVEWAIMLLKIVLINLVLSGDNAVVIAMASRNLPENQRKLAIWWGSIGAVVLRVMLVFVALQLLQIPYLQAAGAVLLLYIAIKLLDEDEPNQADIRGTTTLGSAIWTILVADFVMSLDNVLAIAAIAKGDYVIIFIGVLLSIPLIFWGSTVALKLLVRFPVLHYIGAAILGYTAGEMLLGDHKLQRWIEFAPAHIHLVIPLFCTILALLPGIIKIQKWK